MFQANANSPIFGELKGIVTKTFGVADFVRDVLRPHEKHIRATFIYGSVAKRQDTASSDIDLMVLSDDLNYSDLFGALETASQRLGREIKPSIYSRTEWTQRIARGDGFVKRVLAQSRIWLIGGDDELAEP